VAWLQDRHRWPGLAAVGKITASRQVEDHTSMESRYYLLSQAFAPERFNEIVRSHWGIENQLHWRLDVVFNEDQSRNPKDHCPDNLALLRKLALNLARLEPSKGSIRDKLKRAGRDDNLATILSQFTKIQMQ
jgi:predicted transposase YbfD/YdcC